MTRQDMEAIAAAYDDAADAEELRAVRIRRDARRNRRNGAADSTTKGNNPARGTKGAARSTTYHMTKGATQ